MQFNTNPLSSAKSGPKTKRFIETDERIKTIEEVAQKYNFQIKVLKGSGEEYKFDTNKFFTIEDNKKLIEISFNSKKLDDFWKEVDAVCPPSQDDVHHPFERELNPEDYKDWKTLAKFTVKGVNLQATEDSGESEKDKKYIFDLNKILGSDK